MPSSSASLGSPCVIQPIGKVCGICLQKSVQARAFKKAAALAGFDAQLQGLALAIDGQWNFHAGLALGPETAEEPGEIAHALAGDLEHDIAGAQICFFGGAAIGEADDDQAILNLGGIE